MHTCVPPHPLPSLQDASKARETKLRKAGIQGRARMAGELREMDDDVAALSRELAVSVQRSASIFRFVLPFPPILLEMNSLWQGGDC